MPERCGYCGRFTREVNYGEWGSEWVCSQQDQHILADPEHWTVYVNAYDIGNGDTYTGPWPAKDLPRHELVRVLEQRQTG